MTQRKRLREAKKTIKRALKSLRNMGFLKSVEIRRAGWFTLNVLSKISQGAGGHDGSIN